MVYQLPPTDFSWARFATFFLYAFSPNATVKLRLYTDPGNYYEGTVAITEPDIWKEYVLDVSTFSRIGNPSLGNITRIGVASNAPILFDVDYLFPSISPRTACRALRAVKALTDHRIAKNIEHQRNI